MNKERTKKERILEVLHDEYSNDKNRGFDPIIISENTGIHLKYVKKMSRKMHRKGLVNYDENSGNIKDKDVTLLEPGEKEYLRLINQGKA